MFGNIPKSAAKVQKILDNTKKITLFLQNSWRNYKQAVLLQRILKNTILNTMKNLQSVGTTRPRGIRNNNPLNLRCSSSPWKGKALVNNDGTFEQFISMYYGFRAAILTIETYILKHGCNTIRQIVTRWAPANENNTENYIRYVCNVTHIGGNEPLSNFDGRLKDIVAAMAQMESGREITDYFDSLDRAFADFIPHSVYLKCRKKHY